MEVPTTTAALLQRAVTVLGSALAGAWGASALAGLLVPGPDLNAQDPPALAANPDGDGALVSVIIPMRDEVRNAAGVVRCVLDQDHAALQVVVVDDESTDGTVAAVRAAAAGDPRLTLVVGAALPEGWVGKPWACHQGARRAGGAWLLFLDADVRLHPRAIRRLLADARAHDAAVVSWVGLQRLDSFWERAVNPVVFHFIAALTPLPLARMPGVPLVAVNGQLLAFRSDAYAALGGHAAVRDAVVEDLALAQAAKRRYGRGYRFVWARELMATRMYRNLAEVRSGWGKNLVLGGAAIGLSPAVVVAGAVVGGVLPWVGALARLGGASAGGPFAVAAALQALSLGIAGRRIAGLPLRWGLAAPAGTAMVAAIAADSWRRTRAGAVTWRGRDYAARR